MNSGTYYRSSYKEFRTKTFNGFFQKEQPKTPEKITPEIVCERNNQLGKYIIKINGETELIDFYEWQQMVKQLGISSYEDFKSRFYEVCSYFIIQAQYVPFEEIKK